MVFECVLSRRPVLHGDGMRQKPLKWRHRIAEYYRMEHGADRGYAGGP